MSSIFLNAQKALCDNLSANFVESNFDNNSGVSKNIKSEIWPINGLRHGRTRDTTGWYIWRGDYSDNQDFFEPMCTEHLITLLPDISKYLGLPPGWRFQVAPNHEDIWFDEKLVST